MESKINLIGQVEIDKGGAGSGRYPAGSGGDKSKETGFHSSSHKPMSSSGKALSKGDKVKVTGGGSIENKGKIGIVRDVSPWNSSVGVDFGKLNAAGGKLYPHFGSHLSHV